MSDLIDRQISKFGLFRNKMIEGVQWPRVDLTRQCLHTIAFAVAAFLLSISNSFAEITTRTIGDMCEIFLEGDINSSTPNDLAARYNSLNNGHPEQCLMGTAQLFLTSNGGDVESAIKAGEFVRQKELYTTNLGKCASSCVLVFLGGVHRSADSGSIGLHRSFSESLSMTESNAQSKYEEANRLILQYLTKMNIPEALLNTMNAVPPQKIKWLNDEQLQELQIVGDDPAWDDKIASKAAKKRGISKKEWYARRQRADAICEKLRVDAFDSDGRPTPIEDKMPWFKCVEKIHQGR